MTEQAQAVLTLLRERGIPFDVAEHVPVYTIEELLALHLPDAGSVAKNLFLRDDKRWNYYLLVIREEKTADLKVLRERIGARPLSFASENDLERFLKVPKGSVTPFGVLNDQERKVRVIFDASFRGSHIGVHPNDNTATVWLRTEDLTALLEEHGNAVSFAEL